MSCVNSFVFCALLAMSAVPSPAAADEAPAQSAWRERIETQLTRVEMTVKALDKLEPPAGSLLPRVTALHARLVRLESGAKLEPGSVRAVDDLSSLTMDVTSMGTRSRALVDARSPKKATAPVSPPVAPPTASAGASPPPVAPSGADPQKPARAWPERLQFSATAKVVYQETGEWFISKNQRSGLGNDFLMDGYAGTVSFSLRAKGLKNDIASADIRVSVKLKFPFASDDNTYRVYDVRWTSTVSQSGRFGNDSLKSYPRFAAITASGPIEWIKEPKQVTLPLSVEAHVTSITLSSGDVVTFESPEFTPKQR